MYNNYNYRRENYRKERLLNEVADRVAEILYEEYRQGRIDEFNLKQFLRGARNLAAGAALSALPYLGHGQSLSQNLTKDYRQPTYMTHDPVARMDVQMTGRAEDILAQGSRSFPQAAARVSKVKSAPYRGNPSGWGIFSQVQSKAAIRENLRSVHGSDESDPEGLYQTYIKMYYNPEELNRLPRGRHNGPGSLIDEIKTFPERFQISSEGAADLFAYEAALGGHNTGGAIHISQIKLTGVDKTFSN